MVVAVLAVVVCALLLHGQTVAGGTDMFSFRLDDDSELRLLEERHAEALFALTDRNRAYLREWMPWVDGTTSVSDTRGYIRHCLREFAENRGFQAGLWVRGDLAGSIGYVDIDWNDRKAEIGYWLGASFQGRGLMTRACRALVDHAFKELRLNRVEIVCAVDNHKSRAIPERLDFVQEGVLRQAEWLYDHFVDHVVYAALADGWRGTASLSGRL
jgi:ribosomal-protein-serine acetyltransferase